MGAHGVRHEQEEEEDCEEEEEEEEDWEEEEDDNRHFGPVFSEAPRVSSHLCVEAPQFEVRIHHERECGH